jgi:hypothetical protein
MNFCKIATIVFLLGAVIHPCAAEPMMAPTKKEAAQSKWILLAKYVGYKPFQLPVTYFDGVMAEYQITKILKGPEVKDPKINVSYAFHDGSACLAERNWTFSDAKMPQKGSGWILFLEQPSFKSSYTNAFITYRGDFGRVAATSSSVADVQKLISK